MANVPGTFYTAETQRRGTTPVSPPSAVDDPIDPVNPSGPPVVPPVAERYASEAAMIADQLNQKSGYLYFDGTDTWWYLGTTNGDITDYEAFGGGGGGADTNAVHYNASDGKSATEKQQARDNIGLGSGIPYIDSTSTGVLTDYVLNSNIVIFTNPGMSGITGMDAGVNGEEVILVNMTGAAINVVGAATSFNTKQFNQSDILANQCWAVFKYETSITKWIGLKDSANASFLRKNIDESTYYSLNFVSKSGINDYPLRVYKNDGTTVIFEVRSQGNVKVKGLGSSVIAAFTAQQDTSGTGRQIASFLDHTGANVAHIRNEGSILHAKSTTFEHSIRRDEQRLYYPITVTTAGAINDLALTNGNFNYRFTAATSITGFTNGEIGRTIDVDNATGATLTIQHENTGSIAANRIKLIGAADIVMPIDGKMTIKYCTGSRWELVSKNF